MKSTDHHFIIRVKEDAIHLQPSIPFACSTIPVEGMQTAELVLRHQIKSLKIKFKIMKKVLVSAIALFSIVSMNSAVAQKGFSLSVKASPQFNWMNNTNDKPTSIYDRRSTFGASFGVGGQYNFTDHMGVGLDVLYSLQGQKYHLDGEKYHQKNDYVKVPLLFAFTAGPVDKVAFYGKVGPQLSFLTNSKLDGDLERVETRDRFRDVTLGGAAAAGVQFALAKNISLNTGLRVDHDFTNVENNNNPVYNSGTAVSHNSTLGLEVGLNCKFK